ncbi:YdcF family protein [Thiohalocapsa marina]|uniref:YdcF family protein n=1 Tax=Thiohalocapsa marina TaxID=424902 RepID=A0A5M8FJS4_9GAMM|nr:YdcF family protein [Thiohalocapsa marina]KAA6185148.1 YdcF family protein [Thiohalocapsa marina]
MLYLDKLITQLAYPLGLSLALCCLALLLLGLRRRRLAAASLLVAVGWLGVWSLPVVSDALRWSLEGRFEARPVAALPAADAVVVLGGGMRAPPPGRPYPDLGAGADRAWQAARLFHAGKADIVILSGGRFAWQGERPSEAEAMRAFLRDLGVPDTALRLEGRSRNTRENAVETARLLAASGLERVLLVTSALHMPRALASFRATGVEVIPAPTDFEVMPEPAHPLRWLPDAAALADSTRALKEYLGLWVYRWRGWAD